MPDTLQKKLITIDHIGTDDDTRVVLDTPDGEYSFFKIKKDGTQQTTAFRQWKRDGIEFKDEIGIAYGITTGRDLKEYRTIAYFIPVDDITVQPRNTGQQTAMPPQKPEKASEVRAEPDWEKITQGKVRSLLVEALITQRGLTILTDEDKIVLDEYIVYCMTGK